MSSGRVLRTPTGVVERKNFVGGAPWDRTGLGTRAQSEHARHMSGPSRGEKPRPPLGGPAPRPGCGRDAPVGARVENQSPRVRGRHKFSRALRKQ